MARPRVAFMTVLAVVASLLATFAMAATPAAALQAPQSTLVSAVPASFTPDVNNGTVFAIGQVGGTTYLGGSFTSVSAHGSATAVTHNFVVAFNASTGALDNTSFLPTVNGEVDSIIPGPAAGQVYIAGSFSTVDGVAMKVALLNTSNGSLVSTWKPSAMNGSVNKIVLRGGVLYAGGLFTTVGGASHIGLASLNPSTGAVTNYVGLAFTGQHNYGTQCDPTTTTCSKSGTGVKALDVDSTGTHMVVIGNFTCAAASCTGPSDPNFRDQIARINLGATSASLDPNWATAQYTAECFSGAYDSYVRDVQFSPDGSYFVVAATGGSGTDSDGGRSGCDSAERFETTGAGSNVQPTWVDFTGQDTFLSLAVTGTAVYVGGHQRWVNNSQGFDFAGPGAVPRPGIVALDPVNGMPFSWNPGRDPRGAGAYSLLATANGLYVGSDTDYIGNRQFLHKKIAYFPLAGGETVPSSSTPALPGRVYTAGAFAPRGSSNVLYRFNEGGPTIPAIDNGPDWQGDDSGNSNFRNTGSNTAGWSPVANVNSSVPPTTPEAIFDSERWDPGSQGDGGEMHFEFPVPAGDTVDVRLYLANRCDCTSAVGNRIFDVNVDGQPMLSNFDMVAAAGDQTGMMRHTTVTSNGEVTIDFGHETENPLVDGIEIVKTAQPTSFPAPLYRIDAGGDTVAPTDPDTHADWLADGPNTTDGDPTDGSAIGTGFRTGGNSAGYDLPWGGSTDATVPSTTPHDIFGAEEWDPGNPDLDYTFPVDPGTPVTVKMYFANNFPGTSSPGARQFNVLVDGTQVLTSFDPVGASGGDRTGHMESTTVTAPASGLVTIDFSHVDGADNPLINGIELVQTAATPPPSPTTVIDPDRLSQRHVTDNGNGTVTVGSESAVTGTGITWSALRGAFTVNGELIYGKNDGKLYERSINGTSFGPEVALDPYDDPNWDAVQTGSGQTYASQPPTLFGSELSAVSSMFFTGGRLFYTISGQPQMHWRWFEPESGVVGSDEFTTSDSVDYSHVAGAFVSGNTLYFADKTSGQLESAPWNGTNATASPTVLATGASDWASRGIFMLDDAAHPNQPPVAAFTPTCSTTNNACTFDASASNDPDGSITGYSWNFGDGTTEQHLDGTVFTHTYANATPVSATLTVTDNDGLSTSKTLQVTPGQTAAVPSFKGATSACSSGTALCGKSAVTSVGVPAGTASGDALLLFVTWPATTTSATVPAGWHLLDKDVSSPLESDVYYRPATNADITAGTVQVTFGAAIKNGVTLADYSGAAAGSIEAYGKSTDSATATHITPTVAVTTPGSLAVSYWADKSSTTKTWTLPAGVHGDKTFFDTGAGYITSVLGDSTSTVGTGNYGGKTATTDAPSGKGVEWTIILAPQGSAGNQPPSALFTSTCSGLTCAFDGSGSTDPDGTVASYAWDFGDGGTSTIAKPSHTFAATGPHTVKLTVTDNQGAPGSLTKTVTVSAGGPAIGFVGSNAIDGTGATESVKVPAAASPGDALLLFESHASTTGTSTAPAGWTLVGTTAKSNLTTHVYEKTAAGTDASSTVTVTYSAAVKASLMVADYTNTSATPIEVSANSSATATTSHITPALTGLSAGSWVVTWWTDKSTTTTTWTPPNTVIKRAVVVGTGTGADGALLADSGAAVSGSYASQTATTNAKSGSATQWAIALSPAG